MLFRTAVDSEVAGMLPQVRFDGSDCGAEACNFGGVYGSHGIVRNVYARVCLPCLLICTDDGFFPEVDGVDLLFQYIPTFSQIGGIAGDGDLFCTEGFRRISLDIVAVVADIELADSFDDAVWDSYNYCCGQGGRDFARDFS